MTRCLESHGHRGARGLWPENTLEGFARAIALGVDAIEMDVAMTADGILVVSHNPALNPDLTRGPDGNWLAEPTPMIRDLPASALATYDVGRLQPGTAYAADFPDQQPIDGARIPTLAAVFQRLPPVRFNIETKSFPDHPDWSVDGSCLVEAVVAAADTAEVTHRIIIQSFDWSGLIRLRRVRPEIAVSFLTDARTSAAARLWWDGRTAEDFGGSVPRAIAAAGGLRWGPQYQTLTMTALIEAHTLGLHVIPWTVNAPEDMRRLIDWGVDGLITDRPDRLRCIWAENARPASPGYPPAR